MHLKILTNRIVRLDSAEQNARRKLKLAHKRALHLQAIKRSKNDDSQRLVNHKDYVSRILSQKREEILNRRQCLKQNIILNKNVKVNQKRVSFVLY